MNQSFFDPNVILSYQLGSTLCDIRNEMDKRQAQFNLSRNEWLVIGVLLKADKGCLNQNTISQYMRIENSYLTKVLNKLIHKKIIKKVICEKDQRQRMLSIHPQAENLIKKIATEIISTNEEFLKNFSLSERKQLFNLLTKIRENISEKHSVKQ